MRTTTASSCRSSRTRRANATSPRRWRRRSWRTRRRTQCWCGATARTSGAPTGSPRRRTRSATTTCSAPPWRCGAPEFRRPCKEGPMRAYRLEDPRQDIAPEELRRYGVRWWAVPDGEAERAEMLSEIKRDGGYVDEDYVELGPATPNLE